MNTQFPGEEIQPQNKQIKKIFNVIRNKDMQALPC